MPVGGEEVGHVVLEIARYPELTPEGDLFVPVAPPPAPTFQPITGESTDLIGRAAVIIAPTKWVVDVRIISDPYVESDGQRWYVHLCDEGLWFDLDRHRLPVPGERIIVASVRVVFALTW
ncbi:MAG: hypothetical protein ACRCYX_16465 [Dermatophilaceae bacterium]